MQANASLTTPARIEDYIILKSQNEGVSATLALHIAKSESGLVANAHNPIGTASGIFQFLDSTFLTQCVHTYHLALSLDQKNNPAIQINCAIEMLKEPDGWKAWLASYDMWHPSVET